MSGETRRGKRPEDLATAVRRTVQRHDMARPGDGIVVGVSGGVDSMCLLDVLCRTPAGEGFRLVVAHVHHGLRGEEADRECRFVEQQAFRYGLRFEGVRIPSSGYEGKGNLQARARELRYAFYEEVARKHGARRIATGHHRDDRVETILMQWMRGAGGLRGISPVRDNRYIRPLMEVGRTDILRYAESCGVPYVEDPSNRSRTYLRNRIRQDLVPWIRREANPSFERVLIRLADILKEDGDCLDALARDALDAALAPGGRGRDLVLRRAHLERLHPALRKRVVRFAYERLRGSTWGLSFGRLEEISRSMEPGRDPAPRRFELQGGVRVFLEQDLLLLSESDLWDGPSYSYPLLPGKALFVPEADAEFLAREVPLERLAPETLLDRDQAVLALRPDAAGTLRVRSARPGDRFRPRGAGGGKKIQDYFVDSKVPRRMRASIPLLEVGGEIAWVAGMRQDERFRIRGAATECLHVRVRWKNPRDPGSFGGKKSL